MGFFSKLAQTAIDIAVTPVEIVKDVATVGGVLVDRETTFTADRLRKISEHAKQAYDELE